MTTMVNGDVRILLTEQLVGGEPLEIGAGSPAVQEQQRWSARLSTLVMSEEHFAATAHRTHVSGRQRGSHLSQSSREVAT